LCIREDFLNYKRNKYNPSITGSKVVNKRFANYYNAKYRLTGHVFEKRYYDQLINDKEGMLEVSRYIHLNPVKANRVKAPENYPWSSYYFLNIITKLFHAL
jgi:hypothetical protein